LGVKTLKRKKEKGGEEQRLFEIGTWKRGTEEMCSCTTVRPKLKDNRTSGGGQTFSVRRKRSGLNHGRNKKKGVMEKPENAEGAKLGLAGLGMGVALTPRLGELRGTENQLTGKKGRQTRKKGVQDLEEGGRTN